ncbi:DUF262 domain-containing protein [Serratia fonticola]|uniref:DUF262 domain-containing protein n=1 Tax=Serratia fonticola TaxID=47917 RepID=UPI00164579E1|nr:DUF262 domain-containing protein [Serratia fonticola]MBC3216134.1 DUF262 domain-containing protein [Serratia fonticola]
MNFDASPLNIKNILSVKQRYVIPRNQREFSWERLQLDEFWQDIIRNIAINKKGDKFELSEYFIGTVVLSGIDSDDVLEIVDGQQRMSVITILLSLISRALRKNEQVALADDIFKTYIVTVSDSMDRNSLAVSGESFVEKISRNTGRDYFKVTFQDRTQQKKDTACEEDRKMSYAGTFFQRKLQRKSLCQALLKDDKKTYSKEDHNFCLNALYKMITNYLKLVKISVDKGDDAYDIFEVLNARGINLSSIDLIKNKIFQNCTQTYPADVARKKWEYIIEKLEERDGNNTIVDYVRCWWLSKFNYIGDEQLYRAFKREILDETSSLNSSSFLDALYDDVDLYVKIINPNLSDWPQQDQRKIYESLNAFSIFNVSIPRPFILSLLRKKREKPRSLKQEVIIDCLKFLEKFHFRFNAVCRLRPSGVDAKYSVLGVAMSKAENKREAEKVISDTIAYFSQKSPSKQTFKDSFSKNIFYVNAKNAQRKLIIYIFENIERSLQKTRELKFDIVSLEHIGPQKGFDQDVVGMMGNLLPLCFSLNESCKNNSLKQKLPEYAKSHLKQVKDFVDEISKSDDSWTKEKVKSRTVKLAEMTYDLV